MVDVIALGELLIDFTMLNTPSGEAGMFQRNPEELRRMSSLLWRSSIRKPHLLARLGKTPSDIFSKMYWLPMVLTSQV